MVSQLHAKGFSLDTRQQVCLILFLEVAILLGFFEKKLSKIATSKEPFKATACRLPKATFYDSSCRAYMKYVLVATKTIIQIKPLIPTNISNIFFRGSNPI